MAQTQRRQAPPKKGTAPGRAAPKKAPLSPEETRRRAKRKEEAARARELARQRRQEAALRRRALFRVSFAVALVFLVLYVVWVAVDICTRSDGNEDALPLLIFTDTEKKEDMRLEVEEVSFGGKLYLPVTALEPYMAISQFGDYQTRSFLLCESGQYATFYLGTPLAIVNGVRVNLKEIVFVKDDILYLPMDFYTDKMNCFTLTESTPLAANVFTFLSEVPPAFRFHTTGGCPTVDPATIPVAPTEPAPPAQ